MPEAQVACADSIPLYSQASIVHQVYPENLRLYENIMATASTHVYSVGSLTGPLPFAQVIRSLLKFIHDERARRAATQDAATAAAHERRLGRSLANTAEGWTQKRIEYLDAVQGPIIHKDTRLFDHDRLREMEEIRSYEDLITFLNGCNEQDGFRYERE